MMSVHDGTTCMCNCHNGPDKPCDIIGGCGSTWTAIELDTEPEHVTIDGEQACIYGCTTDNLHKAGCPCHNQCPDHEGHCSGCAPRPSHGGLICGSCFHRKLRSPLRRVPAIYDWLNSRKAGLKATAYDSDMVSSSKDAPLPFNPDIVDHLAVMDLLLAGWVVRIATTGPPGVGPDGFGAPAAATWIEKRASWVAEQDWVKEINRHLSELEKRSKALAPWQPTRHALPVPCFRCEQQTLVLFGGEDWVTCTAPDCDAVFGWSRYEALSRALGRIYVGQAKGQAG